MVASRPTRWLSRYSISAGGNARTSSPPRPSWRLSALADRHWQLARLPAAQDLDLHRLPPLVTAELRAQRIHISHRLPVDRHDHAANEHPRLLRRAARLDRDDQQTRRLADARLLRQRFGERRLLRADTQISATHAAMRHQRI